MKRVIFWVITGLVILGAYVTLPRNSESLPQEYATVNVPNDVLNSPDVIARGCVSEFCSFSS